MFGAAFFGKVFFGAAFFGPAVSGGPPPDPGSDISYPVTEYFSKRPPPARVRA
jgi:hypothetical protein